MSIGAAFALALPGAAQAFVLSYAAGDPAHIITGAHSYTYQGDRHSWVDNTASYPGSASFGICAVIKGFTDRVNYAGPYCASNNVNRRVTCQCSGYMDAGVGNQDDIARYVYGCADTVIWEIYPC